MLDATGFAIPGNHTIATFASPVTRRLDSGSRVHPRQEPGVQRRPRGVAPDQTCSGRNAGQPHPPPALPTYTRRCSPIGCMEEFRKGHPARRPTATPSGRGSSRSHWMRSIVAISRTHPSLTRKTGRGRDTTYRRETRSPPAAPTRLTAVIGAPSVDAGRHFARMPVGSVAPPRLEARVVRSIRRPSHWLKGALPGGVLGWGGPARAGSAQFVIGPGRFQP